ncbi:MAG: hypothetical protein AABY32_01860 [Nanoarchaeota archaeon]
MSNNSSNGGIGFCGMLCILFIGLKLTNNIDWSWVWVLSPIWIPLGIFWGGVGICSLIDYIKEYRENKKTKDKMEVIDQFLGYVKKQNKDVIINMTGVKVDPKDGQKIIDIGGIVDNMAKDLDIVINNITPNDKKKSQCPEVLET